MYDTLSMSLLFKGYNSDEIKEILSGIHYNIHKYKKDELIFIAGDNLDSMIIVLEGSVSGEMVDSSGRIFRIENIHKGMAIAPGFLFGLYNYFPVNVVTLTDCKLISIPKNEFHKILMQYESVNINLLNIVSNKTQFLALKIKSIFMQTIRGKIALYLIDMANNTNSSEFEMDTSQTELARKFNVARPSVARVFSKMKQKGIIELNRRKVKIIDEIQLRNCINRI